jgi:hypothetical protein
MNPKSLQRLYAPRNLWKHCIHPDFQTNLMLIGFARPSFGNVPIIAELQVTISFHGDHFLTTLLSTLFL